MLSFNPLPSVSTNMSTRPQSAAGSSVANLTQTPIDWVEATHQDLVVAVKEDYRLHLKNTRWTKADGVEALATEHQPWARSVLAQTSELAASFNEDPPENDVIIGQPFPRFQILVSSEGHLLGGQLEYRQKGGGGIDESGNPIPLESQTYPNEEAARAAGVDLGADVQWHTYPPQYFDGLAQPLSSQPSRWEWCGY